MGNVLQFRERTRALIIVQSHLRRYLAQTELNEDQMNKRKRAQEVKKKVGLIIVNLYNDRAVI